MGPLTSLTSLTSVASLTPSGNEAAVVEVRGSASTNGSLANNCGRDEGGLSANSPGFGDSAGDILGEEAGEDDGDGSGDGRGESIRGEEGGEGRGESCRLLEFSSLGGDDEKVRIP